MSLDVESVDRYTGGPQPHPWRYCRGGCEAMGAVPVRLPGIVSVGGLTGEGMEQDQRLLAAAWHEHGLQGVHECDGWHFVVCPSCGGTGEIPWHRALRYVPRMVRGTVRFVWQHGLLQFSRPPHWTRRQQLRVVLMIAGKRYGR